jgi:hypothetical protein
MGLKRRIAKLALRGINPKEVTQMVTNRNKHNDKSPAKQGSGVATPEPNKISASTPYDFNGKNLTPYHPR